MFRQGEDYNYMKATGEGVASTEVDYSATITEENFAEFNVYNRSTQGSGGGGIRSSFTSDDSGVEESLGSGPPSGQCEIGQIPSGLKFDSVFESGNLYQASRVLGRRKFVTERMLAFIKDCVVPLEVDQEYDLTLQNDVNTSGNIQWFYFSATIGENCGKFPLTVRFNLVNMQKSDALYNYGMKPLTYSEHRSKENGLGWTHGCQDICYYKNGKSELKGSNNPKKKKRVCYKYSLSFTYIFEQPDTVFFAHCYPYTYTMMQNYLNGLSAHEELRHIFRRKQLCKSVLGNRCDLLTITGPALDSHESRNRKAIVISARVHPGETNASFMMQGVIDFLISDITEARILRQLFVFKIVPMLNPDGVIHGNYRCSIAGADLNRRYGDAHRVLHPEITAMKELLKETNEHRGVLMYLDLHGHSRNKNAFLYGCDFFLQPEKLISQSGGIIIGRDAEARKIYPRIFPKILSTISNPRNGGYFEFRDCSFKVQKSKLGTGRVVTWMGTGVEGAYTVELSFCGNGNNRESRILKNAFQMDKFAGGDPADSYSYLPPLRPSNSDDFAALAESSTLEADDGRVKESDISKDMIEQDSEFLNLVESYKAAKHYTQGDYKAMGRDLCRALQHFANVRSFSQVQSFREDRLATMQSCHDSPKRAGHEFLAGRKGPIETLREYASNQPLVYPSVFSVEAIRIALENPRIVNAMGDEVDERVKGFAELGKGANLGTVMGQSENVSQEPPFGYRLHSEITLRKLMKIDADQINVTRESEEDEEVLEEAENDNGSDSDPSVDTTPVDVVVKRGFLGERAMSLMGLEKKVRKKSRRPSNSKKPTSAPKETVAKEVVEVVRRRLPPRVIPISERRRRDQSEGLVTLSSGSTQRLVQSLNKEEFDRVQAQMKIQSIVFPPDDQLCSLTSRAAAKAQQQRQTHQVSRSIDVLSTSGVSSADGERHTKTIRDYRRNEDLSSMKPLRKTLVSASDRDVAVTLQALSDRYRGRANQIKRQAALSSLETSLSPVKSLGDPLIEGTTGKLDITTCRSISALSENIRTELDNLALGMKANNSPW